MRWTYRYSKVGPGDNFVSWTIFQVQQKDFTSDSIRYTCLITDSADGRVTDQYTMDIMESRKGLHGIRAPYLPLAWVPARYFSKELPTVRVDQYMRGRNILEWYGVIEQGVGFSQHYYTNYLGNPGRITERWEIVP